MRCVAALLALLIAALGQPARAQDPSDLLSKAAEARFEDLAKLPPGVMLTLKARLPAEWEGYLADVAAAQSTREAYPADPESVAGLSFQRFLSARIYQSATAPPSSIKRVYRAMRDRSLGQKFCDAPRPTTEPWILMIRETSERLALYTAVQQALVEAIADSRPSAAGAPEMTAETWAALRAALTAAGGTSEQIEAATKSHWNALPPPKICETAALLFGVLSDGPDSTAAAYWAAWVKPRALHTDKAEPDKNVFPLGSWDQALGKLEKYRPLREGFPAEWAHLRRELEDGVARQARGTEMWRIINERRESAVLQAQSAAGAASAADIHSLLGTFAKSVETVDCASPAAAPPRAIAAYAAYERQLYEVMRRSRAKSAGHGEATATDRESLQAAFRARPGFEKKLLSSTATAEQCRSTQLMARASADLPPQVAARLWASAQGPILAVARAPAINWTGALEMPDIQGDFPKEYAIFRRDFEARQRSGADDQTLLAMGTAFAAQMAELQRQALGRAPISEARAVMKRRLSLLQTLSARHTALCARLAMGVTWPEGLELDTQVKAAIAALALDEKAGVSAGAHSPVSWEALRASDWSTYRDAYEQVGGDLTIMMAMERNRVGNIANDALCHAAMKSYEAVLSLPDAIVGRFWRQISSPQSWVAPEPTAALP